jgi:YD repeat-containing protein
MSEEFEFADPDLEPEPVYDANIIAAVGAADERVPNKDPNQEYPLWTSVIPFHPLGLGPEGAAIGVDGNGTAHVVWSSLVDVYYANNRWEERGPNGNGFSSPFNVSENGNSGRFPFLGYVGIAVEGNGTLHIVWAERAQEVVPDSGVAAIDIIYRKRNADGTWESRTTILAGNATFTGPGDSSTTHHHEPVIGVSPTGVVHVACRREILTYVGGIQTVWQNDILYGSSPGFSFNTVESYDVLADGTPAVGPNRLRVAPNNNVTNRTITIQRDTLYRVDRIIDPLLKETDYDYDANSNITSVRNPRGFITTLVYDKRNLLKSVTTPAGTESYQYDREEQTRRITNGRNFTSTSLYDKLGRIKEIRYPGAGTAGGGGPSTHRITYTYDANGNKKKETSVPSRVTQFEYDARDNMTRVIYPDPSLVNERFFDNNDNLLATHILEGINFRDGNASEYDERNRGGALCSKHCISRETTLSDLQLPFSLTATLTPEGSGTATGLQLEG